MEIVFIVMFEDNIMKVFSNWQATNYYMVDNDWDRIIIEHIYEDS